MSTYRTTDHPVSSESNPALNTHPLIDSAQLSPVCPLGICSTCVHQGTCLFLKASHNPVWFCDEFSDVSGGNAVPQARVVELQSATDVNFGEAQRIGLCTNCETRKECMHRRPGEPVWECEDYK